MTHTFKIALAALTASVFFVPAATAQVGVETRSISVSYGDLDLTRLAGGVTLLKRIEGAARQVCGSATPYELLKLYKTNKCRRDAVRSAVRDLNFGMLTHAWSGKYSTTSIVSR